MMKSNRITIEEDMNQEITEAVLNKNPDAMSLSSIDSRKDKAARIKMHSEPSIGNSLDLPGSLRSKSKTRSISTTSSFGMSVWHPGQKFMDKGRPTWPTETDSVLVSIGAAVGVSNIVGFPLMVFRNGGTAFLIPYLFFTIVSAFPILYMERILGQFIQQGCLSIWKIVPIFKGVGYAMQLVAVFIICCYSTDLAWSLIYIFESFNSTLAYTKCNNDWNTKNCIVPTFSGYNSKGNITNPVSAGSEYFRGRILRIWPSKYADGDAEDEVLVNVDTGKVDPNHNIFGFHTKLGTPIWDLTGCIFAIYCCYFVILIVGIKLIRKISWITVLPPYIILPILLFRGITLNGAPEGVLELIKPNFAILATPGPWVSAAIQALFSTSAGLGIHTALASRNFFRMDPFRGALWICIADTGTSIFASLVLFCYIGNAAYTQNVNVSHVVGKLTGGTDLTFELFPDVVGNLAGARFYIMSFYLMVFLIGFNSGFSVILSVTGGFLDEFKQWFPAETNSEQILNFALTSWAFVFSLMCGTRGGIWMHKFILTYVATESILTCSFLEIVVVCWWWGLEELCNAVEAMSGRKPGLYLRLCWKFFSPISFLISAYFSYSISPIKYNHETAPSTVATMGRIFVFLPSLMIPLFAIYQLFNYPAETFKLRVRLLLYPTNEHHEIKRGHFPTERSKLSHIFYVGLRASLKKNSLQKQKIHPADPSIVVTHGSHASSEEIRPNENTQDPLTEESPQSKTPNVEIPPANLKQNIKKTKGPARPPRTESQPNLSTTLENENNEGPVSSERHKKGKHHNLG